MAGAGYFDIDSDETTTFDLQDPDFGFTDITTGDVEDPAHQPVRVRLPHASRADLTLTVGASGDLFDETGEFFSDFRLPGLPPDQPVPIEPPRSSARRTSSTPSSASAGA